MITTKPHSLSPRTEFHSSKSLNHGVSNFPKSRFINPHRVNIQHKLLFQVGKFHISPKPTHFFQSPVSRFPHHVLPSKSASLSPHRNIIKFFSEKVVVLLLWSFIFVMGCLKTNPSLAVADKTGSVSGNTEEKWESQEGKSEHEDMYERLLEREPRNVEALKVVVYGKMRRREMKPAVEYVERLISIEPREVEWRLLQAHCYEMMGQLSKAKKLFEEILEESPLLLRALHGLAVVMHKNFEDPAVFEMLSEALEIAHREQKVPEERNIKILIAQMLVIKGELKEALKKFEELLNENPRDFRPYLCQGIIYSLLDRKKEAAEQFEMYQSLVPEEFPQRVFLDDVVLAAKTKSPDQLQEELEAEFSYRK